MAKYRPTGHVLGWRPSVCKHLAGEEQEMAAVVPGWRGKHNREEECRRN